MVKTGTKFRALAASCVFVALAAVGGRAKADLVGVQFTPTYHVPDLGNVYASASWAPDQFTVGNGTETVGTVDNLTELNVDFDADSLVISISNQLTSPVWNTATFNGVVFAAAVPLGLSDATVDTVLTTMPGFDDSRVTFTDNEIRLNWQGLSSANGLVVAVDFTFGQVPEPGTLALLGIAVAAAGAVRLRRPTRQ